MSKLGSKNIKGPTQGHTLISGKVRTGIAEFLWWLTESEAHSTAACLQNPPLRVTDIWVVFKKPTPITTSWRQLKTIQSCYTSKNYKNKASMKAEFPICLHSKRNYCKTELIKLGHVNNLASGPDNNKWQLSFFTFQSISEVLKSSISLSAFTVMIDHQREESIAKIHWIWFYKCLVIWPLDQTSTSWQSTHKTYHYCRTGFPQDKWIIHLTCHHIM